MDIENQIILETIDFGTLLENSRINQVVIVT